MAVSFMPDQRERNGQFFSRGFINGNGQGDQLTLVELIIVMAVVWRRGDVVMAGLRRLKHRLFETGQAHGDITLTSHLSEHLIKRLCVAALPEDADMRIAQESLGFHSS